MIEGVTACIVTRGDHDLDPIIYSLADAGIPLIKIWDNSKREQNLEVYGRYALIGETDSPLIYVQDDDCVLPTESIQGIIWESDSGASVHGQLVCNMPPRFRHGFYDEHSLVGFGACFHRSLPFVAFDRLWKWQVARGKERGIDLEELAADKSPMMHQALELAHDPKYWPFNFLRTCDVLFTALTPHVIVDEPYENLPWAEDDDRMYRQPGHAAERSKMLEMAFRVKDAASE